MKPTHQVRLSLVALISLLSVCILCTACSPVWEKNISMRKFNHPIECVDEGLSAPQTVAMDFSPQIDVLITRHRLFLAQVDSMFVEGLDDRFENKLDKCNIWVTGDPSRRFRIRVDHILFQEELIPIRDVNAQTDPATIENRVAIVIRGSIIDTYRETTQPIDVRTKHQTETDSASYFNLLSLSFEQKEDKVSDTFVLGMVESNAIQSFANQCSEFIRKQVGHE